MLCSPKFTSVWGEETGKSDDPAPAWKDKHLWTALSKFVMTSFYDLINSTKTSICELVHCCGKKFVTGRFDVNTWECFEGTSAELKLSTLRFELSFSPATKLSELASLKAYLSASRELEKTFCLLWWFCEAPTTGLFVDEIGAPFSFPDLTKTVVALLRLLRAGQSRLFY